MVRKIQKQNPESGQSLIETIAAIFVLTMALTSALGLAIYVASTSSVNSNEIIATNLAREGVEVVRMFRDTNWLASEAKGNGGFELEECNHDTATFCYPKAYQNVPSYANTRDLGTDGNYRLVFTDFNPPVWNLSFTQNYDLYLQANGSYTNNNNGTSSNFARMVSFSRNTNPPYSSDHDSYVLVVKSIVAWRGKNCPAFNSNQDLNLLNSKCKVVMEERLTNWKNY